MLDEVLGTIAGLDDLGHIMAAGAAFGYFVHGQFGISQNSGEDVVEVMGDAAGQGPDRFHFLRLNQLPLQVVFLGHITLDADVVANRSGTVRNRYDDGFFRVVGAALATVYEIALPGVAIRDGVPELLVKDRFLKTAFQDSRIASEQLAVRIAGDFFQGRVDIFDCSGAVGDQDELGSLLDGDLKQTPFFFRTDAAPGQPYSSRQRL